MLTVLDTYIKRVFDIVLSSIGIIVSIVPMFIAWIVASIETRSNGLFIQKRIGYNAKPFLVFKIKTMKNIKEINTTVTQSNDIRITKSGAFFRKTKIDELPQLFNVFIGTMSFVGPRPDVEGFADMLTGEDRVILTVKPGITGPASLKYKDEEALLAQQKNPEQYNRDVIWKDKVAINRDYIKHWSLKNDIKYIIKTILG